MRVYFLGGNIVEIADVSANTKIWIHEDGTFATGFEYPSDFLPSLTNEDTNDDAMPE